MFVQTTRKSPGRRHSKRITETLDSNSSKSQNVKLASGDKSNLQVQSGSLEAGCKHPEVSGWIVVQDARREVAFTW